MQEKVFYTEHGRRGAFRISSLWFPVVVGLSLVVHGGILVFGQWKTPPSPVVDLAEEQFLEVEMVEELPPVEEPPPPEEERLPEPPPPPMEEPEPLPEVEELQEVPPEPAPTPMPVSTPPPKKIQPPPAPKPVRAAPPPRSAKPAIVKAAPETHRNPPPAYPQSARRNAWQGKVVVRASVSPSGRVEAVSVARSSGHSVLDQAALAAVKKWRFRPGTENGTPVASTVEVPVNFRLE